MVHIQGRNLMALACICLPTFSRALSPDGDSVNIAESEIICSPTNATDCYPKIFVPTKDFQPIREGQDIPRGLHVQMDIYTSTKQARLNIPMEGEEEGAIEGTQEIPMHHALVEVEQPEPESTTQVEVAGDGPAYDDAGKIQQPPPSDDDFGTFQQALLSIAMESRTFDAALDDLNELSHDIYYGLETIKNGPVLEKLICLLLGSTPGKLSAKEQNRDHKAASLLASALQNNPTALKEIGKASRKIMYPICGNEHMHESPSRNFVSVFRKRITLEKEPGTLKAKIGAISNLIKEPTLRDQFLEKKGMEMLLAVFLKEGDEFDIVRKKISELVTDNFLDDSMGAKLGVWPKLPALEEKVCSEERQRLEDGCWEYHVGAFSKAGPEQTRGWAKKFLATLKEQRSKFGGSMKDREL